MSGPGGQDHISPADFTRWNYGGLTQASEKEDEAGYTEFGAEDSGVYSGNSGLGYGFAGKAGSRAGRAPLPMQEEMLPEDVASEVAQNEKLIDGMPGVLVKGEDGSLKKIVTPGVEMPLPDFKPEPTRFDKSVESILNGRNAAMFVAVESKKRGWNLEFEEVDQVGPVHDRTYTYSLTIGSERSEDVLVSCGIAKGKKEAKRRCCEDMVLKISDLPPAPPLHMQPHFQMQMMRFRGGPRGRFMRGRFPGPGFRPRLPPPESEDTIFKKYDSTPRGDHPSKNHPISKLCEYIRKHGWPVPQWDLINEKIIQQRKNKHGNANIMLYTYKVTLYPGKGQVEPKVYFGSGPTKKDAKFACGSVAWANIEGGVEPSADATALAAASKAEAEAGGADTKPGAESVPVLDPKVADYNPMQMAVSAISDMNKRVRGPTGSKEEWLDSLNKNLEQEQKVKRFMELPADLRPPTQLITRQPVKEEKKEVKEEGEAEDGEIREERKRKRKSRWENPEEEPEVKKEPAEEGELTEKPYLSRSSSREKVIKEGEEKGERSKSRSPRVKRERSKSDRDRPREERERGEEKWKHDRYEQDDRPRSSGGSRHNRDRRSDREERKGDRDDRRSHRDEGRSHRDEGRSHRDEGRSRKDEGRSKREDRRRDRDDRRYEKDDRRSSSYQHDDRDRC